MMKQCIYIYIYELYMKSTYNTCMPAYRGSHDYDQTLH